MGKKIGIISDTHGLVRKEAIMALKGCEMIIHVGDVGRPEVIDELKLIAPVIAVRGNVDRGIWAEELPLTEVVQIENVNIWVIHDISTLDIDPKAAGINVVIYGHSHKMKKEYLDDVLYVNPGSAGPRRFDYPVSLALMKIDEDTIDVKFIDLGEI